MSASNETNGTISPSSTSPNSTLSTSSSPTAPSPDQIARQEDFKRMAHYVALGTLITVPIIIALPPRKLDLYTLTLVGCGVISGNHLIKERYNRSLLDMVALRTQSATEQGRPEQLGSIASAPVPGRQTPGLLQQFDLPTEKSRTVHDSILEAEEAAGLRRQGRGYLIEKARKLREQDWGYGGDMARMLEVADRNTEATTHSGTTEAPTAIGENKQTGEVLASAVDTVLAEDSRPSRTGIRGMAQNVLYGKGTEGQVEAGKEVWKEQRQRELRDALDEGKGIGEIISDQIYEVFNWDKEKNEDGEWVVKKEYQDKYKNESKERK